MNCHLYVNKGHKQIQKFPVKKIKTGGKTFSAIYQGLNSKNLNQISKKLNQTVNMHYCKAAIMDKKSSALHAVKD